MKISYKVPIVASTIVLLAFTIFSAIQYKLTSNNLYSQLNSNMDENAITLDHQISNWLNGKLALVNSAADIIKEDSTDPRISTVINTPQGKRSFQFVYFVKQENGRPIVNNPEVIASLPADEDLRVRPWYRLAMRSKGAVLTEAYVDETSPFPMISAVARVKDNFQTLGVTGGDISTESASKAMNKINFGGAGYIFLTNGKGEIIIHPNHKLYGKNVTALYGDIDIYKSTLQETVNASGEPILTKFRSMSGLQNKNWMIGIVVDKDTVMAETYNIARNAIIGTLLSVILCSLLLYWFMNSLVIRPILSLTEATNEISRGNLEADIEGLERNDEVGELSKAIQRMQKSLAITLNRLKK